MKIIARSNNGGASDADTCPLLVELRMSVAEAKAGIFKRARVEELIEDAIRESLSGNPPRRIVRSVEG